MSKPTNQPGVAKVLSLALPIYATLSPSLSTLLLCVCVCVDCVRCHSSVVVEHFTAIFRKTYYLFCQSQTSATVAKWFLFSTICAYATTTHECTYICMNRSIFEYSKKTINIFPILNILEYVHCMYEKN